MFFILLLVLQIFVLYLFSRFLHQKIHRFFYRLTKSEQWANWLFAAFFLPGTFLHEVAHFLTALVLLVPVGQLELMPEKWGDNQLKMGSVPVAKADPVRRTLIGVAPFVFGLAIIFVALSAASRLNLFDNVLVLILLGYLVFEVGNTMFASAQDLEGAWVLVVGLGIIYASLYFLGIRITIAPATFLSEGFLDLVKKANLFLLVPMVIDFTLISLLQVFSKS